MAERRRLIGRETVVRSIGLVYLLSAVPTAVVALDHIVAQLGLLRGGPPRIHFWGSVDAALYLAHTGLNLQLGLMTRNLRPAGRYAAVLSLGLGGVLGALHYLTAAPRETMLFGALLSIGVNLTLGLILAGAIAGPYKRLFTAEYSEVVRSTRPLRKSFPFRLAVLIWLLAAVAGVSWLAVRVIVPD